MWPCSCSWMPYRSSDKYGMLSVSANRFQFPNPVYINCGPVVALGRPIVHMINMVCLVCLPKVPNSQIKCI